MADLQPAPELVDPATPAGPEGTPPEGTTAAPAPADGQQAGTTPDTPPVTTYKVGDTEYTVDELTGIIETATNASKMHKTAHEKYAAANEALEQARAIENDEELRNLRFIIGQIKQDRHMAQEWGALREQTFNPNGTLTNNLAIAAKLEQLESKLGTVFEQKAEMQANDVLRQFAEAKGLTHEQAEAIGAKFLEDTKAEDFPIETSVLKQLEFYHWQNYEQGAIESAKQAGYNEAIAKVKAGHAAELGSPSSQSEVPWVPPKDANENPMNASFDAAMADESIRFDDNSLT
jgi:hypothetical protein